LLPDREPATAEAWLCGQPQISVVARDRGGGYALAAAKPLPNAIQVADRWHLMENPSRAFLDAVQKSMRQIRAVIGATIINPGLLTLPSGFNMKAISVEKKPTLPFLDWQKTESQSERSFAAPHTAAASFATCRPVGARMSSALARVRSNRIFNGSTRNGPQA